VLDGTKKKKGPNGGMLHGPHGGDGGDGGDNSTGVVVAVAAAAAWSVVTAVAASACCHLKPNMALMLTSYIFQNIHGQRVKT
jgi:hypothetical protein